MNSRHFITTYYGGIRNGIMRGSQIAAVIHSIDQRIGYKNACGKGKTSNPFRGIAHSNGSSYSQRYFRHIEGARDMRRAHHSARMAGWRKGVGAPPFRDINPVPVSFCE